MKKKLLIHKPKSWYYNQTDNLIIVANSDAGFSLPGKRVYRLGRARSGEVEELVNLVRGRRFYFSNFSEKKLSNLIYR